jgi:hypothetical protein
MTQQTLNDETVVAHCQDGTQLAVTERLSRAPSDAPHQFDISSDALNSLPGLVRYPVAEGLKEVSFDEFSDARVAYGLWNKVGPYERSAAPAVPPAVATDGQTAVTAYIYLNGGEPRSCFEVAEICEVSKQTV